MALQSSTAPQTPTPVATTVVVQTPGVPQTFGEVNALRGQRAELSNQLQSAQRRRNEVVNQLADATPAERPGLEARLKLLDDRILEIEGEISRTGELIAQAPGNLLGTSSEAPSRGGSPVTSDDFTSIAVVFTIFVLAPIAFTIARLIWKRATGVVPKKVDAQSEARMRRLEEGIDAIAIEVERISEGQRFVTRLLSEREKQPVLKSEK